MQTLFTIIFKETEVDVDIKDHETLQMKGFGLIHAVGKGSKRVIQESLH
ncbi:hypothetical protein J4710_01885 [Staphylococcus xylosus]|uniref:Uncharacterized protein n=1 Tax=Staphylococcus xylosus TaxID=1288 RepID=A0A939NBW3_STAXY|nr:hypothetical protein [Staphylococcus xylosus]